MQIHRVVFPALGRPRAASGGLCRSILFSLLAVTTFCGTRTAQAQTFSVTAAGGAIPDNFLAIFQVQLPPGILDICNVELDISGLTHTSPSDLDIYLTDPFGTLIEIMTDRGGSVAVSGLTFTFTDLGGAAVSEPGPLTSGTFLPEGLAQGGDLGFASFDGNAGGFDPWILLVIDDTSGNTGSIASITLRGAYGPPVCSPFVGACCDRTTGVCMDDVEEPLCGGDQRVWTVGVACVDLDPPCDRPRGSCCDGTSGLCVDDLVSEDCSGDQRDWLQDIPCAQRNPPCIEHTGACCDQDPFRGCSETTLADCQGEARTWHKLQTCDQIECVLSAIPAVSEWGLLVLSLLLLIGAKVGFSVRATGHAREFRNAVTP